MIAIAIIAFIAGGLVGAVSVHEFCKPKIKSMCAIADRWMTYSEKLMTARGAEIIWKAGPVPKNRLEIN